MLGAFGAGIQQGHGSLPTGASSSQQPQRRAFTGTVTKLLDNFGFIDDVFFQLSVVRGERKPKLGDTVYVECQYGEHMPFKWNATCVQVVDPSAASTISSQVNNSSSQPTPSSVNALVSTYFSSGDPRQSSHGSGQVGYGYGITSGQGVDKDSMSGSSGARGYGSRDPVFVSDYPASTEANGHRSGFQSDNSGQTFSRSSNQITYTSTPGSAFVQPFIDPSLLTAQQNQFTVGGTVIPPAGTAREPFVPSGTTQNIQKGSRWDGKGAKDDRSSLEPVAKNERRRNRSIEKDRQAKGKDKFGRDIPEKAVRDKERTNERNVRRRSTESPTSRSSPTRSSNVPAYKICRDNMSAQDIRRNYGSKVRVPSDFEVLLINNSLALDLNGIPKPINYKFHDVNVKKEKNKDEKVKEEKDKKDVKGEVKTEKDEKKDGNHEDDQLVTKTTKNEDSQQSMDTAKEEVDETQKEGSKGQKSHLKYSAKVVLLSLPSLKELFERVLGYDFERQTSTGYSTYLSRVISFVSSKNTNGGYSLIGGRFVPEMDGFLSGTEEPNLVNTAIRCVKDQSGLDLSPCSRWTPIGTFVYNRNETIGDGVLYEYTTIFLPDVWSLFDNPTDTPKEPTLVENTSILASALGKDSALDESDEAPLDESSGRLEIAHESDDQEGSAELPDDINDMTYQDMKTELVRRGIKMPRYAKKVDLVALLKNAVATKAEVQNSEETHIEKLKIEELETPKDPVAEPTNPMKRSIEETDDSTTSKKQKVELKSAIISNSTIELFEYAQLSIVSLYQALMHHKNDHFELSVTAELLKESLIRHFAFFICSCFRANSGHLKTAEKADTRKKIPSIVQLYFSFFDERQQGFVWNEDMLELFNCVGFRFSRKTWTAFTADVDKVYYRSLESPATIMTYSLPKQPMKIDETDAKSTGTVFMKNGVVYDIDKLIEQSDQHSKSQVVIKDLQNVIVEKAKTLADYETKQKKHASAIDKQNDEICQLKREKEELRRKTEDLRKISENVVHSLSQGLKAFKDKDKDVQEKDKEKEKS